MFEIEQNSDELNKIMRAIGDKNDVLSDENKETNNAQLEEEIYQQMNLIKLDDLNALSLQEIRRRLDKKYDKMTVEDEINEIGEKLNSGEVETNMVNNVIPNLKNLVNFLEEILIL